MNDSRATRIFGHIQGVVVGALFATRVGLNHAGVHRPTQAGISGTAAEGCDSIVLSGGYEDDKDTGDTIFYTGEGGRDPNSGRQIADQTWTKGNQALRKSRLTQCPVRVVRGWEHKKGPNPPLSGYRYDGLFRVTDAYKEKGRSGFQICRFVLERSDEAAEAGAAGEVTTEPDAAGGNPNPPRKSGTVVRIVRDTKTSRAVKEFHDFRCQVCGDRLETPGGPYAEGAYIRPLGSPHNGPDILSNPLCLCPNHHVLFDSGAFTIGDDLTINGIGGKLRTAKKHPVAASFLRYHREHYGGTESDE